MSRRFIIVDTSDEIHLLLSQYLSMGWHDADIEEESLDALVEAESIEVDAIIITGAKSDDARVTQLLERSEAGDLPPTILINNEEDDEDSGPDFSSVTAILPLEDLTAVMLNGAIVEVMKSHADGGSISQKTQIKKSDTRADNELPTEKIEGLKGYRLIKELGRGGMSRVYLALDNRSGNEVAIKVLDMDTIEDDRMIERFIREYAMLASVDNPHIAKILDQTFTDEYAFIIMERFEGGDLTRRIRKGLQPSQAIDYLGQIAKGLQAIHKEGIVHRDLKPGNILFHLDDTLALLDFGLAQMDDGDADLTKHGEVYGTPSYVSPEQARGKRVDHRSDIYSTGIILFQMLTRKKPYRADNPMAMFYKHVHAEIPKLPSKYSNYQPLLDVMLAKSADDRFQSAEELLDALKDYR